MTVIDMLIEKGKEMFATTKPKNSYEAIVVSNSIETVKVELLGEIAKQLNDLNLNLEQETGLNTAKRNPWLSPFRFASDWVLAKENFKFEAVKDAPADTVLPSRATAHSAGYDFVMPCDLIIPQHSSSKLVFTNIKAKMPQGYYLALFIRSSLAIKKKLMLANSVGIIDGDYYSNEDNDGNIGIKIYNCGNDDVLLKKGERVMQGIFTKYYTTVDDAADQVRSGGIGSTGK